MKKKSFFKLEYKHESDLPQVIYFGFDSLHSFSLYVSDLSKTMKYEYEFGPDKDDCQVIKIPFEESGIYYFEFYSPNYSYYSLNNAFTAFILEKLIDLIDLSQKIYYKTSIIGQNQKLVLIDIK